MRIFLSWIFPVLLLQGCSLLTALEKDLTETKPREHPNIDLFAASKNDLIDEVRKNRELIKILQIDKKVLLRENMRLGNEVEMFKAKFDAETKANIAADARSQNLNEYNYHNLGVVAFSEEKYEDAIANFNKAVALNAKFFEAYTNLGVVYMTLGDYEKALVQFKVALAINPKFKPARVYHERTETALKSKAKPIPPKKAETPPAEPPKAETPDAGSQGGEVKAETPP